MRFRITAVAVGSSVVLLSTVSLVIVWLLRVQLTDNLDEGLRQRADTITAALGNLGPRDVAGDEDLLVQLVSPDGIVTSSANLSGAAPIADSTVGVRTVRNITGRREHFRVLTRELATPTGVAVLHVGINADDVTDPVGIVSRLLMAAVPATVILLGALVWWLTGRTLSPVERIRIEMAAISATNLQRRVSEPGTGDEVDRLAHTMNETLDRLEDAVRRQNKFVADASHELRGPIARIRSELEVDFARPDGADLLSTHHSVLAEAIGLQHLVEELLHLARSDAGSGELTREPVDVDDLVVHETRRLRDRGRVRVDTTAVGAAQVFGDRRQLQRAIMNLLDNAQRHAATTVTVTLDERDGVVELTVADDGIGVAEADRERVFERFARLDEARTKDTGGSGLGLAITRDIVERHGGTITIDHRSRFIVRLPTPMGAA